MITFTYDYPNTDVPGYTVTMQMSEDCDLDEVITNFEQFLKGAGYSFEGQLELVSKGDK